MTAAPTTAPTTTASFDGDKINKPTPTDDEFTNKANWALKFDHKNVRMGKITIPKANFAEE